MRLLRAAVFTAVCVVLAAAGHTIASGRTVPGWSLALGWLAVFAVVAPLAGRERTLPGIATVLAVGQLTLHTVFNTGQMCAMATGSAMAADGSGAASGTGSAAASGTGAAAVSGTGGSGGGLMTVATRLMCGDDYGLRLTPTAARQVVVRAGLDPATLGGAAPGPGMVMPGGSASGSGAATTAATATTTATGGTISGISHGIGMLLSLCSVPMLLGHLLAALVAGWLLRRGEAALWRLIRLSVRGAAGLAARCPAVLRRARALLSALAAGVPYGRLRGSAYAVGRAPGRHRTVWLRHTVARRGPPAVVLAA